MFFSFRCFKLDIVLDCCDLESVSREVKAYKSILELDYFIGKKKLLWWEHVQGCYNSHYV